MQCPHLPNELWLVIFKWAVSTPDDVYSSNYYPFCDSPARHDEVANLKLKSSLGLVCRRWHALTTELLYRDLKILQGPCQGALQCALGSAKGKDGYGRLVRRAVLPYDSTVTKHYSSKTSPSIEILKLCSCLEVLKRPRTYQYAMRTLTFEFDAESVALPSLKRLEWWHNNEAERSGGINSLAAVLENAPNLEYLFVGGAFGMHSILCNSGTITLAHLHTLRLFAISGVFLHQMCSRMCFPALSHVVIDSVVNSGDMQHFWESHGAEIETVEFGKHMRFLMGDEVTQCIELCPKLQDVNYYVFFTAAAQYSGEHHGLHTIGLHAASNMSLSADEAWCHLEKHFSFLLGPALPSLRQVNLLGEWSRILETDQYQVFRDTLRARGCAVNICTC